MFRGFTAAERVEVCIDQLMQSAARRMTTRTVEGISEAAAANYEVEVWSFSRIAKGAMRVMDVLGLVLASVALGVTAINDFMKDAPVAKKTLDTLQVSYSFYHSLEEYLK